MRILVGCEFSQIVTKAFCDRGHEAYSCDLLPTEGNPDWHIQDDVLQHLDDGWDLGIFHDPCTFQCNGGVQWLYTEKGRWGKLIESCDFTKKLLNAPIEKICRENPIPHGFALGLLGGKKYDQIVQPWMFGDYEKKATCLWLKGLPKLNVKFRTKEECRIFLGIPEGEDPKQRVFKMPPSDNRSKERSRFFQGVANAMATQWGNNG